MEINVYRSRALLALFAAAVVAAMALLGVTAGASGAVAGSTTLVSVSSSGIQGDSDSQGSSISPDGRYVAFTSRATNLVENDIHGISDVFVRDRQEGTTERVSVNDSGAQGNGDSGGPSISADGRYVAFGSSATNLVTGDTNGVSDTFVHDRDTRTTERVSVDSSETEGNNRSVTPSISADGRYVAFGSSATNLVTGDTNGRQDAFVRDLQTGTTERVSVNGSDTQGNGNSSTPSISADGRYVAFASDATNLVTGDTNGGRDIFVHDRDTGTTQRVNVKDCSSTETAPLTGLFSLSISPDGRYVSFTSESPDLVANDTNDTHDVFVRDLQTRTTQRVSVDSSGAEANDLSLGEDISADGRYVTFASNATNLVADDTNGAADIFVHERTTPPPNDCIPPTTTASATTDSGAAYESGTWTQKDIKVTLSAQDDEGGSGIKEIRYSATGAQSIAETTYDSQNPPLINTEGTTIISYYATDNADNQESPAKTFTVKIDKSAPTLDPTNTDSVEPDNRATGVSRNIEPAATFSDEMDPVSLTTSTVKLYQRKSGKWRLVRDTNVSCVDDPCHTVTLDPYPSDPTRLLAANKKYKVTFTTGVKNLAGLALSSSKSWTFTTGQ